MKKLVIAAGTGFLGKVLQDHFKTEFEEIIILTRGAPRIEGIFKYVNWDARTLSGWEKELENANVLINMTGKSVDCRYTTENKTEIINSRINSTKILNEAVLHCAYPPKHWLNSSTATIYRHSLDKQMTELNGEFGDDFSVNVAKAWEQSFFETETPKTIKTALRTSIVLGKHGGAFIPLKRLTQFGLGGKQGDGNQFVSWIHQDDFARAIKFIINNKMIGNINIVSPQPIENKLFMAKLRAVLKVLIGIPTSEFILKIGTKIIGTESELVLKSRNVIPDKLIKSGFEFRFGDLDKALKNLIS